MRIAIDISQIVHGTGVSFYTQNLVRNLARVDKKNDYLLLGTSLRRKKILEDFVKEIKTINSRFKARILSLPPSLAEPLGNKLRLFSIERISGPVDVFHSSDWIQFPTQAAKVTTIHDFGFLKYPRTAHPKILAVMKRRLELVKKEVDLIIAISKTTAQDTEKFLNIPKDKIRVIYEAGPEEFEKKPLKVVGEVKAKFGIKENYLLTQATVEPRKNLTRIIKAYLLVKQKKPKISLVIIGKPGWDWQVLGFKEKIPDLVMTGYLDNFEYSALFSGAACLINASLYEGFSLSILDAMKLGCPVVTSNISSMPEVAGDAAILVDPLKVEAIALGIFKALKERQELIKKGYQQVKKFSWQKTARQTLRVYEEAIEGQKA